MRGTNKWNGSGIVVNDIYYDKTKNNDDACSFKIAIDDGRVSTYVRINVYGRTVRICRDRGLKKGDYVVVDGELMNRRGKEGTITEVKCLKLLIFKKDERGDENGRRQETTAAETNISGEE